MVVGIGIDIIDAEEFRAELTDDLIGRLFLPEEIRYASTQARPWQRLAVRLAAKRAVLRALGLLPQGGEPCVTMSGRVLETATERLVSSCHLSVSHTRSNALAVAILE